MATTPNYGWVTPAPTDFVTDLPADFETFADAVDADLAGLLGGTTGQILTKDSATDHDFSWQDAAGGADEFTLLNAGGTNLSGSSTVTVSFTAVNKLFVAVHAASSSGDTDVTLRLNTDSNSKYGQWGLFWQPSSFAPNSNDVDSLTAFKLFSVPSAPDNASASVKIEGANSAGVKTVQIQGGGNGKWWQTGGAYTGTSAITSVSVISSAGNFDAGKIYVWGA